MTWNISAQADAYKDVDIYDLDTGGGQMNDKRVFIIIGFGILTMAALIWLSPRPAEKAKAVKNVPPVVKSAPAAGEVGNEAYRHLTSPERIHEQAANAEAKRLANSKANFPFTPTYHPVLRFDPTLYDLKDSSTWQNNPIGTGSSRLLTDTVTWRISSRVRLGSARDSRNCNSQGIQSAR